MRCSTFVWGTDVQKGLTWEHSSTREQLRVIKVKTTTSGGWLIRKVHAMVGGKVPAGDSVPGGDDLRSSGLQHAPSVSVRDGGVQVILGQWHFRQRGRHTRYVLRDDGIVPVVPVQGVDDGNVQISPVPVVVVVHQEKGFPPSVWNVHHLSSRFCRFV